MNILLDPQFFEPDIYVQLEWVFFVAGFRKSAEWDLGDNYGYFIICILLIIEKHCLEYLTPRSEEKEALIQTFAEQVPEESVQKKVNVIFILTLNIIIIISEATIPMMLLFIAFTKLTIISAVYLLALFIIPYVSKNNQKLFFCVTLGLMVLVQYVLILSNINIDNSPQTPPSSILIDLPWYKLQA